MKDRFSNFMFMIGFEQLGEDKHYTLTDYRPILKGITVGCVVISFLSLMVIDYNDYMDKSNKAGFTQTQCSFFYKDR